MQLTGGIFFYGAGLLLAPYLYDNDLFWVAPFVLAFTAFAGRKKPFFPFLIAFFLVSLGLNQYFIANRIAPSDIALIRSSTGAPARVAGVIQSINSRPDNAVSIDIKSARIVSSNGAGSLQGIIRVYSDFNDQHLLPGDSIQVLTRLRVPRNFRTPGVFNYKRYLLRRNIVATGYAESTANFARIHSKNTRDPIRAINKWRDQVRQLIDNALPSSISPHINALAIGDRGTMSIAQRSLLAESGLAHLFAISGLHLGLIASFLYLLLRPLYLRTVAHKINIPARRLLPPLILPLLFGYMHLTGMAISTLRALIMLGAVTLLCSVSRRTRPVDILMAAIFLILAVDPLAIFEPSFQLSIAGAGGIIVSLPVWQPYLQQKPLIIRGPLSLLSATLAATLATLPFVLLHFHTLAPAGLLLNLFAVPLVTMILLPLIFAGVIISLVNSGAAIFFFKLAAAILGPFLNIIAKVIAIDIFSARTIYLPPAALITVFLVIALLFAQRYLSFRKTIFTLAAITILALSSHQLANGKGNLNIVAIDVGQGDATLLQTSAGGNYLVDGGGLYSKRFDTGERLVAPALGYLGVRNLDAVVLSHDHPDHRKGLIYILENFPVKSFWSPVPAKKLHYSIQKVLAARQIPLRTFPAGWHSLDAAGGLKLFKPENSSTRLNNHSLVLYARNGSDGVLLTGDLETEGIRELADADPPGPVTLMKLPHHGSRKSDPSPLLNKYNPGHTFSSVGFDNRYGLPHRTVIDSLEKASIPLERTDLHGSISLSSDGHNWAITHWKKGLFR